LIHMLILLKKPVRVAGMLFAASVFAMAWGAVARPGTINYAEGQVRLDGRSVAVSKLGSTEVAPGHVLQTENGKAEMLLTPGVFLRLGDHSAARMISPSLTDTRVELVRGEASLEVDLLSKENRLNVIDRGADVHIAKKGLYSFRADQPLVAVYDGKAEVRINDQTAEVGKGKELAFEPAAKLKPQKFDRRQSDPLMAWSKVRSEYLADANAATARTVVVSNPGWWGGTGWYWNPYFDTWAFVPGSGYLYNPWGVGFYSPTYWYYNPPLYYYPRVGRVWTGGSGAGRIPRGPLGNGPTVAPAPAGGSGLRFGGGSPAMRQAPPAMRAPVPAAGGAGLRFGGRR